MANTFTVDIPVGPIWDNEDAQKKCPIACAAYMGTWNGQWTTVIENKMSVCGCTFTIGGGGSSEFKLAIPAGPIWNNEDAKIKCPIICASRGGAWDGHWWTVVEGEMSVCECVFKV